VEKIGVEVADLTPELAEQLGLAEGTKGAVITKVEPDGLAGEAGLRRGMVIVKADRKAVTSAKALQEAVSAGSTDKGVLLQVRTQQGGSSFVLLRAGAGR
jgi:serine protease Do